MAGFSLLKPIGFFYAVLLILVLTSLWYSGKWNRKAGPHPGTGHSHITAQPGAGHH